MTRKHLPSLTNFDLEKICVFSRALEFWTKSVTCRLQPSSLAVFALFVAAAAKISTS